MKAVDKKRRQAMRAIRREVWMGNADWFESLESLKDGFNMHHEDAINFLGDSTNLDPTAKLQASLNAIPFGVSLIHPSIML